MIMSPPVQILGGTCPPCPIGIDAPVCSSLYAIDLVRIFSDVVIYKVIQNKNAHRENTILLAFNFQIKEDFGLRNCNGVNKTRTELESKTFNSISNQP